MPKLPLFPFLFLPEPDWQKDTTKSDICIRNLKNRNQQVSRRNRSYSIFNFQCGAGQHYRPVGLSRAGGRALRISRPRGLTYAVGPHIRYGKILVF